MKPKRAKPAEQPKAHLSDRPLLAPARTEASARALRRWFRLLALLLPLLVFVLLEAGLRLSGYGHSTAYFLRTHQQGRDVYVENPRFGWRFFPSRVARTPEPLSLPIQKPSGTVRIFLFGESAALGDPEPAYGFGRQLECMLQARHPERKVEVINVAMTAINSHVIREIARDCAGKEGDCWLVYAGNNEVVGPYGAGTVFGKQAPPLAAVRLALWVKRTRVGQWLASFGSRGASSARWEGMEMFLGQQVPRSDPRLSRVYGNFRSNLSAIFDLAHRSGAKLLVATLPANLRDCPPFASAHRTGLSSEQLAAWQTLFDKGRDAQQKGNIAEALSAYQEAAKIDPAFAEVFYRRGVCELAESNHTAALTSLIVACELDTLRFRADQQVNSIIRETARAANATLIDAQEQLTKVGGVPVPGDDLFYDHVHLNFRGNYLLATLFLPEVERELFRSSASKASILNEAEVARWLACTDLDRQRVYQEVRLRLQQPPFSNQSNAGERDAKWAQLLEQVKPAPAEFLPVYRDALAARPEDWVLHEHYARALETSGDSTAAAGEWQQVVRLIPNEPEPWFELGNFAYTRKDYAQAAQSFGEVLKHKPDSTEALNGLGLVASARGEAEEAKKMFQRALRIDPRFSSAQVNLAALMAGTGNKSGAISEYRKVLETDTNNIAARINLAQMLFADGRTNEAIELYEQAVAIKPDEAVANFNLANALSARQDYAAALPHYFAAVKARPEFFEGHYNLGLELARVGRIQEALVQLKEAVRLNPEFVDAHFNYGIALARQKQYSEAIEQFQQTLRLQPQHTEAQGALRKATLLRDQQQRSAQ